MFRLRPYQQRVKDDIEREWQTHRGILTVMPTGSGKTVLFASIMHDHVGASCAVVHRKEIVGQISLALAKLGVKHRIVAPADVIRRIRRKQLDVLGKSFVDDHALCGVISVQTLTSSASARNSALCSWLRQVTLGVFDEGHHYVKTGLWAKAVDAIERAKLLFVTACAERADGKGLGSHADGFCDVLVEGPTTKWLMDNGYLSKYKYYAPDSDLDVSDLGVTASGDFNAKALRQRVVDSHLVGDVVKHYHAFASGSQFIAFATDVSTSDEMTAEFNRVGTSAVALNGSTDGGVRDRELDKFERGQTTGLSNVGLFDEGFDVPAVVVVIIAAPTQSLNKFLQTIGRALRIMDGKTHAIIIDPVRNWERHGMPDWPRQWTLDRREKRSSSPSDTVPQRVCLGCTAPYPAYHTECPFCGLAPEPTARSLPEHVDGDLRELDVEALAALFAAKDKANLSDEVYRAGQHARGLPPVARPADMRRHQAAKYRRGVLENLVGWWVGMQPDERELAEIHKRFFLRFGIDIVTAFALNTTDTDALIERITRGFTNDITSY